jgi:MFS family permease
MPHVRRRMLAAFDAPESRVLETAQQVLGLTRGPDGALTGALAGTVDDDARLRVEVVDGSGGGLTRLALEADVAFDLPYFRWFVGPLVGRSVVRALRHQADRLRAALTDAEPPTPPKRSALLPPVTFTPSAAAALATVCALTALANFGGALFGQNADSVIRSFDASNRDLGIALAVTRSGVLVALVATALADRRGRRQLLIVCFAGVCVTNAVSAVAPGFAVFTGAQLLTRAFGTSALVVGAIAVVEEAPDGARAFAVSMLALAGGAGFAIAVVFLPLSDLGDNGWRVVFALSAASIGLLPRLARNLRETPRYANLAARTGARGRVGEVFGRFYGSRFLLLALAAFLTNVFSAPSAQLTNRFLTDEHGFSNSAIALFRGVTNGLPGFFGIVLGGRVAETRGRKPVGIVTLAVASVIQMLFFVGSGAVLWLTSTIAIVAAACSGVALGTLDTELFPTEVRSTSNALLLVCGVAGSATGLLVATNLDTVVGGLGPAIALCGLAPLAAAALVVPWLPEPANRKLDEISPSEI